MQSLSKILFTEKEKKNSKIRMEPQKTLNSQSKLEKKDLKEKPVARLTKYLLKVEMNKQDCSF